MSIKSDMVIGLGTGSTAYFAVGLAGQKLASGVPHNTPPPPPCHPVYL
jgi:ribose 5-phosphate isomerase